MGRITHILLHTLQALNTGSTSNNNQIPEHALRPIPTEQALRVIPTEHTLRVSLTKKAMRAKYGIGLKILQDAVLEDQRLNPILEQTQLTSEEKKMFKLQKWPEKKTGTRSTDARRQWMQKCEANRHGLSRN